MPGTMTSPVYSGRKDDCRHHWVIESPDGPTSVGRCKHCGMRRSFYNVYEDVVQAQQSHAA